MLAVASSVDIQNYSSGVNNEALPAQDKQAIEKQQLWQVSIECLDFINGKTA